MKKEKTKKLIRNILCLILVMISTVVAYMREPTTHGPLFFIAMILCLATLCIGYRLWKYHKEE